MIADPLITPTRQPIVLTASYEPQWLVIMMVFLPVLILGTLIIWIKGRAAGTNQTYGKWLRVPGNMVAIGTGLVALVTYMQTTVFDIPDYGRYLNDSDWWLWPVNIQFWGLLAGACGIFTAAALTVSVAGDVARGGTDPESKNMPSTSAGVFTAIGKGGATLAAPATGTGAGAHPAPGATPATSSWTSRTLRRIRGRNGAERDDQDAAGDDPGERQALVDPDPNAQTQVGQGT